MIQSILKMTALTALQRWMSPCPTAIQPNTAGIKALAARYFTFSTLAILNFQLFLGGTIVSVVAAAHSFDVSGEFSPSSVFWTGLVLAFAALAAGILCSFFVASTKITKEDILVAAAPEETRVPLSDPYRLVVPFFEGVLEGLSQPRKQRMEKQWLS